MRSWGDEHVESDAELRAVTELHGTPHPSVTDRELEHDERLAAADRRAEKAPAGHLALAYTERPTDRERREHFDERRVRNELRPRSGNVEVQPHTVALSGTAGAPLACHADADEGSPQGPTRPPGVGRPTERICSCGAAERGLRFAGPAHRYACPLYSTRVDNEVQAA